MIKLVKAQNIFVLINFIFSINLTKNKYFENLNCISDNGNKFCIMKAYMLKYYRKIYNF